MAISKYLANELNDHVLRNETWTPPTSVWLALFKADTGLDDNTPSQEVSGGGYARLEVGGSSGRNFTVSANKASSNAQIWSFAQATGSQGTVTHVAVMSASTSGNVLFYGTLPTPRAIENGDTASFAIGVLQSIFTA
jgi:hypothetical protein